VTGTAVVVGSSVTYTFSPGSSVVINGVLEAISSFFDFDPLTHIEWESEIQLTGPAPYAGNCFSSTQLVGARFIDTNCPQLGAFFRHSSFSRTICHLRPQVRSPASRFRVWTSPTQPALPCRLVSRSPYLSLPVSPF
jgi:hypothetical protein